MVVSVLNTYWDLTFADEDIKLKEESRRLAQLTLDQNKIQAEVGTMAPLDVVQAEAEVAARDEDLVNSRFARKTAEEKLKKMLSAEADPSAAATPIEPVFPKPLQVPPPSSSPEEAIQRALEIRPEIRQLRLQQENNKIQIDYTRKTYFVLQAQRDLLDAQTRLLRANLDLVGSRIAVDRAVGDTFPANNIQMADALPAFK